MMLHAIALSPSISPPLTAFERSPDRGRGWRGTCASLVARRSGPTVRRSSGFVRCDEEPEHLALHPFGRFRPMRKAMSRSSSRGRSCSYRGAPCGLRRPMRMPGRARSHGVRGVSTVEPPIVDREIVTYAERDKSWRDERMAMSRIAPRAMANSPLPLADADWLNGAFSAGDLLMVLCWRD